MEIMLHFQGLFIFRIAFPHSCLLLFYKRYISNLMANTNLTFFLTLSCFLATKLKSLLQTADFSLLI